MTTEPPTTPPPTPPSQRMPEGEFPTGPAIGERFPDATLLNRRGEPVSLEAARAGRRGLIVFQRSARWWPYCRTQLVELQQASEELERAGVYVAAISYDPVGAIAQFSAEHGITYDFLADEESQFIRQLGILNTLVQPDESVYGIPYPGSYFLDEQGVVVAKVFHREYQLREAASYLLSEAFGIQPDLDSFPRTTVAAPDVELAAQLGAADLKFAQVVALYVRLALPDGLHVSAPDAPEGFIPTSVRVTTEGPVDVGTPRFPASHVFHLEGLEEELRVLDGEIVVAVPLTLRGRDLEAVELAIEVEYQACNDRECFLPQRASMQLRVPVGALNRPPRRDS